MLDQVKKIPSGTLDLLNLKEFRIHKTSQINLINRINKIDI